MALDWQRVVYAVLNKICGCIGAPRLSHRHLGVSGSWPKLTSEKDRSRTTSTWNKSNNDMTEHIIRHDMTYAYIYNIICQIILIQSYMIIDYIDRCAMTFNGSKPSACGEVWPFFTRSISSSCCLLRLHLRKNTWGLGTNGAATKMLKAGHHGDIVGYVLSITWGYNGDIMEI